MKAAKRYAKAFFELTASQMETVYNDMYLLQKTFANSPELDKVLNNPTIAPAKKLSIAKAVFSGKVNQQIINLIDTLGKADRLGLLQNITKAYDVLYKKHKGIKEATVITAVPLDNKLETAIFNKVKALTGSNEIRLKNIVNPAIIGGFILNLDDLRYDASISGKLAKIKSKLVE
jgi:F-type H+-transporting ATPase subunit delta